MRWATRYRGGGAGRLSAPMASQVQEHRQVGDDMYGFRMCSWLNDGLTRRRHEGLLICAARESAKPTPQMPLGRSQSSPIEGWLGGPSWIACVAVGRISMASTGDDSHSCSDVHGCSGAQGIGAQWCDKDWPLA